KILEREKRFCSGKKKFNMDPKKGVKYLVENELLDWKAEPVAEFLYKEEGLNKTAIGEFLGEREIKHISLDISSSSEAGRRITRPARASPRAFIFNDRNHDGSRAMTSEGPAAVGAEPHVDLSASPGWYQPVEQEEAGPRERREEVGDDVSSELSDVVVLYPEIAPIVFFCLKQSTCPRSWCIRLVSSPYPLTSHFKHQSSIIFNCLL
ncbi:cytohesin 4, partial [Triplophysa rosa]